MARAGLIGQQSSIGKALAITETTISTYVAAQEAYKRGLEIPGIGLAVAPLMAATAVINGLARVKQIVGTPIPKVQIEESPFAEGGFIDGASHARGGVWLNAEGGEYIVNKNAMRDPINRGIIEAINNNQQSPGVVFQNGGLVDGVALQLSELEKATMNARSVLVTEDFFAVTGMVAVSEDVATL